MDHKKVHKVSEKFTELLNKLPLMPAGMIVSPSYYWTVKYQSCLTCSKNEIKLDKYYIITCKANASKRTKERVKWYRPFYAFKKDTKDIFVEGKQPKQNGEKWIGWFPLDEIDLEEIEGELK